MPKRKTTRKETRKLPPAKIREMVATLARLCPPNLGPPRINRHESWEPEDDGLLSEQYHFQFRSRGK